MAFRSIVITVSGGKKVLTRCSPDVSQEVRKRLLTVKSDTVSSGSVKRVPITYREVEGIHGA